MPGARILEKIDFFVEHSLGGFVNLQVTDQIMSHWREGATDAHGLRTGLILRINIGACAQLALYRNQKIMTAMETVWITETGSHVLLWQGHRVATSALCIVTACVCRKSRYCERTGAETAEIGVSQAR